MKYCSHCGAEIEDDAIICVHCGCATNDEKAKKVSNNNMGKVALIFMIIGCVGNTVLTLLEAIPWLSDSDLFIFGILGIISSLIPLAWSIPMTVHFGRKYKNGESVGTGFKVCTLLFVNIIAGILMFCMPKDDNN